MKILPIASYGNAFLAAFSMGFVKREMIENWNPTKKIIAEVYEVHDRNYEIFKSLYEVSKHDEKDLDYFKGFLDPFSLC